MPAFYALVDAMPGREADVAAAFKEIDQIGGHLRVKEGPHDFLVRFEAAAFDTVDDFLQTHVRGLPGVVGVEVIQDWDDYGQAVREARDKLA